jgi:hypothetical protein
MPSSVNAVFFENGRFVDYFGNPIDLTGAEGALGPTGPAGITGSTGPTGSTAAPIKFVKEFFPLGPSALIITRAELEAAGPVGGLNPGIILTPPAGGSPGDTDSQFCDMIVSMWSFSTGATQWNHIMTEGSIVASGVPSNVVRVNEDNGDIEINYQYGGAIAGQRIRVVIII